MPIRARFTGSLQEALRNLVEESDEGVVVSVEDLVTDFPRSERWQIISELKGLQDAGRGRFVLGRRGQPSRFIVGDVVESQEEEEEVEEQPPMHSFVLRREPYLSISLPDDLSSSEAKRIIRWIGTLPDDMD